MKGKIYTLLLAVVAVAMAAGIFASCKDYGEDINNLQDQINKAALKSELTTAQSTLQKAADDAKQAADDAMAEAKKRLSESDFEEFANRLEKILRDHQDSLKTAFDKDLDQDEALKDTASNIRRDMSGMQSQLKNDIEGAKTYAEDKVNDLVRDYRLDRDKLLSTVEYNGVRTLLDRSEELLNMVDQIDSLDDFNKAAKKVDDFITLVNALTKAVTSVELIGTFTEKNNIDHMLANHGQVTGAPYAMAFYKGTVGETSIFGDEVTTVGTISGKVGYTKGAAIKDTVNILVRVSPVDADLSKLQAESEKNILIVNSRGEALDDWLNIGNPKKYGDLLSYAPTRATNIGSGIWVIPVAMKPGKDINEFMKVTHPDVKLNNSGELISNVPEVLYAVAVRNTAKNVDTRYAISTYDLISTYENYKPATIFTFKVENEFVETVYNRWDGTTIIAEETQTNTKRDYMWRQKYNEKVTEPATSFNWQTDGAKAVEAKADNFNQSGDRQIGDNKNPIFLKNRTTGFYDERKDLGISEAITCEIGDPITISSFIGGRPLTTADGTIADNHYKEVRLDYYYVVIDTIGAIESAPSEINAWKSYKYEGLNQVYKIGEKCVIKVLSEEAAGDVIGFRVYAVNMDGTLADPDGRAFYVKLDKKVTHGKVAPFDASATSNDIVAKEPSLLVTDATTDPITTLPNETYYTYNAKAYNIGLFRVNAPSGGWGSSGEYNELLFSNGGVGATGGTTVSTFSAAAGGKAVISADDFPSQLYKDLTLNYWLIKDLNSDNTPKTYATKWSEVKYIAISANNIEDWVDDSSVDFTITGYEKSGLTGLLAAKNIIDVTVKKAMPKAKDIPAEYQISWPHLMWKPTTGSQVLTVYPTPVNPGNTYKATADYFTTNFAEFDNAIYANPTKYVWTVEKAGKDNENIVKTSETTSDDYTDYTYSTIPVANIGNNIDYTAYIEYIFLGISRVNTTVTAADDYRAKAWDGKVKFGNALDLITYTPAQYTYTNSGTSTSSTDYFIKWTSVNNPAKFQRYTTDKAYEDVTANLTSILDIVSMTVPNIYLAGKAGVSGVEVSGSSYAIASTDKMSKFLSNYKITNVYIEGNDVERIIEVSNGTSPTVTFKCKSVSVPPLEQVKSNLIVEVTDNINGKSRKLISFPFTLLP